MARNRQRARPSRPVTRRGAPLPETARDADRPPIAEDPASVDFADDDGQLGREEDAQAAALAAFGGSAAPVARPRPRANLATRTVSFLQGSWAELRRVQWPDRQQVVQGTSVVIGFCVLTGIFLGVADYVAGKLVNAIL